MKKLVFIVPLLLFGVLVFFLGRGLKLDPRELPSPLIDKPAPAFALTRLDDAARTVKRDDGCASVRYVLSMYGTSSLTK